jgi:hypothetical protein
MQIDDEEHQTCNGDIHPSRVLKEVGIDMI